MEKMAADFAAEWKWDGIRVQLVRAGNQTGSSRRSGDDQPGLSRIARRRALRRGAGRRAAGARRCPGRRRGRRGARASTTATSATENRHWKARARASGSLATTVPAKARTCAPWAWRNGARRLEALMEPCRRDMDQAAGWSSRGGTTSGRDSGRRQPRRRDRRADAQAQGQPLSIVSRRVTNASCGTDPLLVVPKPMYAQRGHGKRSAKLLSDYTFGPWRTAISGQGADLRAGGQSLFGFHRRGAEKDRQAGAPECDQPVRKPRAR